MLGNRGKICRSKPFDLLTFKIEVKSSNFLVFPVDWRINSGASFVYILYFFLKSRVKKKKNNALYVGNYWKLAELWVLQSRAFFKLSTWKIHVSVTSRGVKFGIKINFQLFYHRKNWWHKVRIHADLQENSLTNFHERNK